MQIGDTLYGFRVERTRRLEEIDATLIEMVYKKNGAKLAWLDRPDRNMTFSIAFRTVPEDDTGVFHILEHSVLCGSRKYPVKEPFVNLLQSSLQTFLNAMTFADKTMYPVASRNRKDFLNLVDVYMDAVFHPAIYDKPAIFRQEGWHYEWGEDGHLCRNGVVFNEMKGVYASVENSLGVRTSRLLYPDTCYQYDAGGAPDAIPTLTYEHFLEQHRRFYHPSNAYIILDGSIAPEEIFPLLDGYLCDYDRREAETAIPDQPTVTPREYRGCYEATSQEAESGLCHYEEGFVCGTFDEWEKGIALRVLGDVLCGSNESPLKKAVVGSGLAENVDFGGPEDGIRYLEASFTVRNAPADRIDELQTVIRNTLAELADDGLDREMLIASINSLEFAMRERDSGSMPKGLIFAILMMETWLYGGDPAQRLCYGDLFDDLRRRAEAGYFETLIRECLLDNRHRARVLLTPSTTCGAEREAAVRQELDALADGWDAAQKQRVADEAQALLIAQQTEDTPEQLASLPHLSLSDVSETPDPLLLTTDEALGCPVLLSRQDTAGILYADLMFDCGDLTEEELCGIALMSDLLDELGTQEHPGEEFLKLVKMHLGALSCHVDAYGPFRDTAECTPYITVSVNALAAETDAAAAIAGELMNRCLFRDDRKLRQILKQKKQAMRESITESGTAFAVGRVQAAFSARGAIREYVSGVEQYRFLCRLDEQLGQDAGAVMARLEALYRRVFTRSRLTVGLVGCWDASVAEKFIQVTADRGKKPTARRFVPLPVMREGLVIPAAVSFTAMGANLSAIGGRYSGEMSVVATMMSFGYLWNVIRVQNGAYGAGMAVNPGGDVRFTTYRDPHASHSLDTFRGIADFLRKNLPDQETLNDLIISAIGEADPLLTPKSAGRMAIICHMIGETDADFARFRSEMLHTDTAGLLRFADELEKLCDESACCVIGGREQIDKCGDRLQQISELN